MNQLQNEICLFIIFSAIVIGSTFISGCSMNYSGEKLFFKEGCSQCHTYKGKGGRMGPDLSAVTNLKTDSWIDSYIQNPKKMNSFARMPSFAHLSSSKRKAIISFLKNWFLLFFSILHLFAPFFDLCKKNLFPAILFPEISFVLPDLYFFYIIRIRYYSVIFT